MTYVTWVFMRLFGYPREKAEKLMWDVHTKGRAVVSSGPLEKAESDVARLHAHSGPPSRRSRDVAPFRRRKGRFSVTLGSRERELLSELCRQTRELLEAEDPSSDPSIARLFPAAYKDDPLRSLEFETNLGDAPKNGKLGAIETMERTLDAKELSEEELLQWMGR